MTALNKQLGLSAVDADHVRFQKAITPGTEGRPAVRGLLLSEYFEWAEVRVVLSPQTAIACQCC